MADESEKGALLIAEQLARFRDQLTARTDRLEESLRHRSELENSQLQTLTAELVQIRKLLDDHEMRIRATQDGVTSFKVWSGLAGGGSSLLALISIIKAFFGGQ
jgi:hypothetical protein